MTQSPLNEFDADEWFDAAKRLKPEMTRAEFDEDWAEFQRLKAEHQRKAQLS